MFLQRQRKFIYTAIQALIRGLKFQFRFRPCQIEGKDRGQEKNTSKSGNANAIIYTFFMFLCSTE